MKKICVRKTKFYSTDNNGTVEKPWAEIQFGTDDVGMSYGHAFLIGPGDDLLSDLDEIAACWGINVDDPVWEITVEG